jgi:hypothetical protein
VSKLQEKRFHSSKENIQLQNVKIPSHFLVLWVVFSFLDLDTESKTQKNIGIGHWTVKQENKENLERSLGEISAATEVQVDQLTISLENWFQNFIYK